MMDLGNLRNEIDITDKEIVRLFEKRMRLVEEVAQYKIATGKQVLDPGREAEKLETLGGRTSTEFNRTGVQEVFRQMMSISRKRQYQILIEHGLEDLPDYTQCDRLAFAGARVVFQIRPGEVCSNAEMCAAFDASIRSFYVSDPDAALQMVSQGAAEYAVLPVGTQGGDGSSFGISELCDLMIRYPVSIVRERNIVMETCADGDAAVQHRMRCLIVSAAQCFQRDAQRISICFELPHQCGTLYNILSHFIFNNLNLTRIESRPIQESAAEYRFFIDFDGNLKDSGVQNALCGIRAETEDLRLLGNY